MVKCRHTARQTVGNADTVLSEDKANRLCRGKGNAERSLLCVPQQTSSIPQLYRVDRSSMISANIVIIIGPKLARDQWNQLQNNFAMESMKGFGWPDSLLRPFNISFKSYLILSLHIANSLAEWRRLYCSLGQCLVFRIVIAMQSWLAYAGILAVALYYALTSVSPGREEKIDLKIAQAEEWIIASMAYWTPRCSWENNISIYIQNILAWFPSTCELSRNLSFLHVVGSLPCWAASPPLLFLFRSSAPWAKAWKCVPLTAVCHAML